MVLKEKQWIKGQKRQLDVRAGHAVLFTCPHTCRICSSVGIRLGLALVLVLCWGVGIAVLGLLICVGIWYFVLCYSRSCVRCGLRGLC